MVPVLVLVLVLALMWASRGRRDRTDVDRGDPAAVGQGVSNTRVSEQRKPAELLHFLDGVLKD